MMTNKDDRTFATGAALTMIMVTVAASACTGTRSTAELQPASTVYTIAIVASTPTGLPKCTSSLAGTTAFVAGEPISGGRVLGKQDPFCSDLGYEYPCW
jgi:hypothetical protein